MEGSEDSEKVDIHFSASEVDTEKGEGLGYDIRLIKAAASVSFLQTQGCKRPPARVAAGPKPPLGSPSDAGSESSGSDIPLREGTL